MPLDIKAFSRVPENAIEWARYLKSLLVSPDNGTITDDTFANRAANSVIGRASGTAGPPADIAAGGDGRVLIRRSGTLQFDGLTTGDLPSSLATDSEVSSAASAAQAGAEATAAAALAVHAGAADPHTGYQKESEKDAASGYAGLNASSRTTKGVDTTADLIIDSATTGLVLKDTQGTPHYWRVTVSTTGVLTTTDLGTTKP